MNDRSDTTTSTGPSMSSRVRARTLVRSCTWTRGSSRQPPDRPGRTTSTATTPTPRRSRMSVKPPVEAPASRQRRPATESSAQGSQGTQGAQWAPREAQPASSPSFITTGWSVSPVVGQSAIADAHAAVSITAPRGPGAGQAASHGSESSRTRRVTIAGPAVPRRRAPAQRAVRGVEHLGSATARPRRAGRGGPLPMVRVAGARLAGPRDEVRHRSLAGSTPRSLSL